MSTRLETVHRLLTEAADALAAATGPGSADSELISALTLCEGAARSLDRLAVHTVAALQQRGAFAERGYRNATAAVVDLLGCEWSDARRRVLAAEQVCERITLDGSVLPARLPATAAVFDAGRVGLAHVEVIARVLGSDAAGRLATEVWADAETILAGRAAACTVPQLLTWGTALVDTLDQDGADPEDRPPRRINELRLSRRRGAPGGTISGRFDDAAMFDAIATVADAHATPRTADDQRTAPQRAAEALADVCGFVLDHGDVPECGGRRPHLNVLIRLDDLENRARSAMLDLGGTLSPESLRMLACDAAVVPILMNGQGQPLDVGRLTRTIPDGLRRAIAARDGGCARCGRPPGWCEVHHVREWENGGETKLDNCVMLCRACHRLIHASEWQVRIHDGLPEFVPPGWIDGERTPRRRPLVQLLGVA